MGTEPAGEKECSCTGCGTPCDICVSNNVAEYVVLNVNDIADMLCNCPAEAAQIASELSTLSGGLQLDLKKDKSLITGAVGTEVYPGIDILDPRYGFSGCIAWYEGTLPYGIFHPRGTDCSSAPTWDEDDSDDPPYTLIDTTIDFVLVCYSEASSGVTGGIAKLYTKYYAPVTGDIIIDSGHPVAFWEDIRSWFCTTSNTSPDYEADFNATYISQIYAKDATRYADVLRPYFYSPCDTTETNPGSAVKFSLTTSATTTTLAV